MFLRRLLESVKDIKDLVRKQAKAADEQSKRQQERNQSEVKAEIRFDEQTLRDANAKDDRNFQIQRSLRNATRWAFVAAFIYAGIAAFQFHQMKKATKFTGDVAVTSAKQLDLAERPWVKLAITVSGPLKFDGHGLSSVIRIVPQNSGNSPAVFVIIKSEMLLDIGWQDLRVAEERTRLCGDLKKLASENREEFETFFPGAEETPRLWNVNVPKADVDRIIETGIDRGIPLVVSCVVYRSTFNDTFHETAYTSTIGTFDPAQNNGMGMGIPLKSGSTINPERLLFVSRTHAN
jgi:hypothetical protein